MTPPVDLGPLLPSDPERRARRDALLDEISGPPEPRPLRRPVRKLVPLALASAVVATIGLGGTSVVVGTGGVPTVDVLAAAHAATAPTPGKILHVRMQMHLRHPVPGRRPAASRRANGEPVPTVTGRIESWRATAPVRTRTVWFVRLPGRPGNERLEASYADGVRRESESWREGVRVTRLGAVEHAGYEQEWVRENRSWVHGVTATGDPVAVIRGLLDDGHLRDGGRTWLNGRAVRRLVGAEPAGAQIGVQNGPTAYEYLVDATTFAPVRVTTTRTLSARPKSRHPELRKSRRIVDRWTFETFERLPMTPENEKLLTVTGR